jgi:hypothetical protein
MVRWPLCGDGDIVMADFVVGKNSNMLTVTVTGIFRQDRSGSFCSVN